MLINLENWTILSGHRTTEISKNHFFYYRGWLNYYTQNIFVINLWDHFKMNLVGLKKILNWHN